MMILLSSPLKLISAPKVSSSSKIRASLEILQLLSRQRDSTSGVKVSEKAIVFSQWRGMLDLVEVQLKNSSIQYRRLNGRMSVHARDKVVKDFNTIPEVTVMIMSLKATSR